MPLNFPSNPDVGDTYSFGGKTWIWTADGAWKLQDTGAINSIPIGNSSPSTGAFTTLTSSGNTTLGNILGNLLPAANLTYNLGSTSQRWKDLWLSNSSIYMGDVVLGASAGALTINGANVLTGNAGAVFSTTGNISGGNLLTSGVVSATGNVTGSYILGDGSQLSGIITSVANINSGTTILEVISSGGNIRANVGGVGNVWVLATTGSYITGVESVTGNIIAGNFTTAGLVSATGTITSAANVTGGNITTVGLISATGNITGGNVLGGANVNATTHTGTTVSVTGNIDAGNLRTAGLISATGTITGSSLTGTIVTASQTNITSVGTLGSLSVTGNVDAGNLRTAGLVSATGTITGANITGSNFITAGLITATGNISSAANIAGGNILTGGLISATGNITGGNINGGANVNATTHTGTTVSVTGNVTGGNILTGGYISATGIISSAGNITGANFLTAGLVSATGNITGGNVLGGANVNATTHTGTTVSVTGNVDAGNLRTAGLVSATGTITGANITGSNFITAGLITATGNISSAANIAGGNILTGGLVSATGAISGAAITGTSLNITTGTANVGSITNANANGVGNIGNSTVYFNTVFAKATSAQYADLAEMYETDSTYPVGTVLVFGGVNDVTISTQAYDTRIAGTVSENPSYIMNAGLSAPYTVTVALLGRVPCLAKGNINKGDLLTTSDVPGVAQGLDADKFKPGCVLGKALQSHQSDQIDVIEIAVGRL